MLARAKLHVPAELCYTNRACSGGYGNAGERPERRCKSGVAEAGRIRSASRR
jgi:hypothetical protein